MMNFTTELKKKIFTVFNKDPSINILMSSLEDNDYHSVRNIIEKIIYNLTTSLNCKLKDDEYLIHNSKIETLKQMSECESEIEMLYENTITDYANTN